MRLDYVTDVNFFAPQMNMLTKRVNKEKSNEVGLLEVIFGYPKIALVNFGMLNLAVWSDAMPFRI